MRQVFIVYCCTLILGLSISFSQPSKIIDWEKDIDFLSAELAQKHYNLFSVKTRDDFQSGLEKIRSTRHQYTDFEIAVRLQQLIATFGDSHTRLNFGQLVDKTKILPLQVYWFADGLYILQSTQEHAEIIGHQILSVNGVPLKTIADSLSTLVTVDNKAMVKITVKELFPLLELHEHFGFISGDNIELKLKDLQGEVKSYTIRPSVLNRQNRILYKPDSIALCYRDERVYFSDNYLTNDHVYYLIYYKCWSKELELKRGDSKNAAKLPSFQEFEDKVFQQLSTIPIKKIVCDLRFNEGGSSQQGSQFIEKLSKYLKKNPEIKLYVIVGRNTFSSAILNAMDFKRMTNAVFVGEETAGKPNHFGELKDLILPSSGIRVTYSTKYFNRTNEIVNTITPDIKAETSFVDFKRGVDPAYEWIRKQ